MQTTPPVYSFEFFPPKTAEGMAKLEQTSLELWQGSEQLTGKLRKGQGYKDAADVVNLLSRFFVVSKAKVKNPTELAQELAYRARYLRRLAVKQLEDENRKLKRMLADSMLDNDALKAALSKKY